LFGAIMTKMELFWSSTYFFMTLLKENTRN
jgi:hypothetical protein